MNLQNSITMLACGNIDEVNQYYHGRALTWIAECPIRKEFVESFLPRPKRLIIAALATSFQRMDANNKRRQDNLRRLWDEAYQAWDIEPHN